MRSFGCRKGPKPHFDIHTKRENKSITNCVLFLWQQFKFTRDYKHFQAINDFRHRRCIVDSLYPRNVAVNYKKKLFSRLLLSQSISSKIDNWRSLNLIQAFLNLFVLNSILIDPWASILKPFQSNFSSNASKNDFVYVLNTRDFFPKIFSIKTYPLYCPY